MRPGEDRDYPSSIQWGRFFERISAFPLFAHDNASNRALGQLLLIGLGLVFIAMAAIALG